MTVPANTTSGSISLSQIQTEYGLGAANPISLSEYINGGLYVNPRASQQGVAGGGASGPGILDTTTTLYGTYGVVVPTTLNNLSMKNYYGLRHRMSWNYYCAQTATNNASGLWFQSTETTDNDVENWDVQSYLGTMRQCRLWRTSSVPVSYRSIYIACLPQSGGQGTQYWDYWLYVNMSLNMAPYSSTFPLNPSFQTNCPLLIKIETPSNSPGVRKFDTYNNALSTGGSGYSIRRLGFTLLTNTTNIDYYGLGNTAGPSPSTGTLTVTFYFT